MNTPVELLLFDIGGVLVELGGISTMMDWLNGRLSVDEMWHQWLHSPTVRAFESGRIAPVEFGRRLVAEFALTVGPEEFLAAFATWPKGLFPGVVPLLEQLTGRFPLATLSNTNAFHWERTLAEMNFAHYFDYHFPSHQTGLLKPDVQAFCHVVEQVGYPPETVLFFDDNQINVDGARAAGLRAFRTQGVGEVARVLAGEGLAG